MKTEQYLISGMACAACSAAVTRVVSRLEGVTSCEVNLITTKMTVSYDDTKVSPDDFKRVVEKAGFGITPFAEDEPKPKEKPKDESVIPILLAAIFSFILLLISMGPMIIKNLPLPQFINPDINPYNYAITQMLLTLPALFVGRSFFTNGIPLLFKGHPNMDSLVSLGAGASLVFSIVMTYTISHNPHAIHNLYFESVAVVITLVKLGKYFENRSRKKTSDAIKKLMDLSPDTAIILRDGVEYSVETKDVSVGDILLVKAGAKIPLDGVVVEGFSGVDESMLTGESMPVEKTVGSFVTGGSINTDGALKIKVIRIGKDTTLSKIIKFVEEAQSKKAPISKTADKVAGIFVPAVIIIAVLATVIWLIISRDISFALKIFTGVLVVACPCALGLATPTAIMVGTGLGANNGILIRNGEVLEISHKVKTVVFDKTGTVTNGKPIVTDVLSDNEEKLAELALLAESGSSHPLSLAITEYANNKGIKTQKNVSDFKNISGKGIYCKIDECEVFAGTKALLQENGIACDKYSDKAEELASSGKSVVYLAFSGELLGLIAVADSIKPDAEKTITELKNMGIRTVLLSGDNKLCAEYIAKQIGADEVYSEVLPEDKAKIIKIIREKYGEVMMVGDGINDAIALSGADVGCAIGSGSDIAIEAADIVLMKSNPYDCARAIKLSRLTIRNIKQNLFWAFCYNTVLIPVAAGVLYPLGILINPMLCGLAMSLSSVFVVGNALRLKGKRLEG